MSRRHALFAVAAVAAAGAAGAFVRETTTPGNPAGGTALSWACRQITYHVNATSAGAPPGGRPACPDCVPCLDTNAATAAVNGALSTWGGATRSGEGQACTDFTLQAGAATTQVALGHDGVNLVVFRSGWCGSTAVVPASDPCRSTLGACAAKYNCWEHGASGTLGLTTVTFDTSTGQILDADVEFHGRDYSTQPTGALLTCADSPACAANPYGPPPQANCVSVDVASLALHEAGHVLGLDHTCQYPAPYDDCPTGSVMQPTIPEGSTRRTLVADDVEGVCTLYPRGTGTLTCQPPSSGGGCGCGAGEGNGALALAVAALAALRPRRRAGRPS